MVTLLFFDCEFTDLSSSASLISAGFISQSGEQFYAELSDYPEDSCNDFVKAAVLPLLSLRPISTADFISSLTDWLSYRGEDFLFIADSDWDQKVLAKTFASIGKSIPDNWWFLKTPDNFTNGMQRCLFNDEMAAFFLRHRDLKPHHALADAQAIRSAYLRAESGY
ncbi:3'-5' exoribonuclease [Dechloromonas sp. XY25]|uniref:3'-5' exoribonuclease n=1 Tax=Dechloromonas hankyongensis TaxID=2908002 RepID=A0ABS9K4G9_9RHOO|nr:3'-5' exoribonuclease [Dechloromonas hankyongensis]MCG2578051.1 3'-5' exoribonuclease [Dechloromonas hankyongensis]